MRTLIVYNKKSGLWNMFDHVRLVKKALGEQCESIEIFELKDWSGEIFKKFVSSKFDLVVAIGGDGTVKTCAALILDHMPESKLRIVPVGSTNVLATSLGMKLNILKNISRLRDLRKLREVSIDVGCLNNREYFLEGLIVGYLAKVIIGTEQNMKNKLGFGGYLLTFFKHRKCPKYDFELIVDGQKYEIRASTLMALNAMNIFGLSARKEVLFHDGVFDIFYKEYKNIWGFLASVMAFFFFRKLPHISGKNIRIIQKSSGGLADAQTDGDMVEREGGEDLVVEVLPKALKVLV